MALADLAKTQWVPANRCITCWLLSTLPSDGDNGSDALRDALASEAPNPAIAAELSKLGYQVSTDAIANHRKKHQ